MKTVCINLRSLSLISILLAVMIVATGCSGVSGDGGHYTPSGENTEESTSVEEVDLSALPEDLRDNILLGSKYKGSCKELKGNVIITVVIVSEPDHPWTDAAIQTLKNKHTDAAMLMKNEAASYGTILNLYFNYVTATVDYDLSMQNFSLWAPHAMQRAGLKDLQHSGSKKEQNTAVKAPPFSFV